MSTTDKTSTLSGLQGAAGLAALGSAGQGLCTSLIEGRRSQSGNLAAEALSGHTLPRSGVGVTSTCGALPAMVITPTVFSGLACVLAPASRLTQSAWAWKRVGA